MHSEGDPFQGKVDLDFFEEPTISSDGEEEWPRTRSWKATVTELSKERESAEAEDSDTEKMKPKSKEENEDGEGEKAEPQIGTPTICKSH